jgi:hypothetical protein
LRGSGTAASAISKSPAAGSAAAASVKSGAASLHPASTVIREDGQADTAAPRAIEQV